MKTTNKKRRRWLPEETLKLKQIYSKWGPSYAAEQLGRPYGTICLKAHNLGLVFQAHRFWTKEEVDFIRSWYGKMKIREIAQKLQRQPYVVYTKVKLLGLKEEDGKYRRWTKDEDNFVRQWYGKMKIREIAQKLGRTTHTIYTRALILGINKRKRKCWTEDDNEFLRHNYLTMRCKQIAQHQGRTLYSIYKHAYNLRLRKYSKYKME